MSRGTLFVAVVVLVGWLTWHVSLSRPCLQRGEQAATPVSTSSRQPMLKARLPSPAGATASTPPASEAETSVSREQAQEALQRLVDQYEVPDTPLPALDFRPEDSASPSERADILEARRQAEKAGVLLVVARFPDGSLHFRESRGEFPRSFFPERVRKHLTEHDWEVFQVAMEVAAMRRDYARLMNSKQPNKAPEPNGAKLRTVFVGFGASG